MSNKRHSGAWTLAVIAGLTLAVSWTVQGGGPAVHSDEDGGGSITKVNSAIKVADGETAGALKTVNGSVTVGEGARAERIEVVNGKVRVGSEAVINDDIESVNGAIELGERSRVEGDVGTVNGRVSLAPGARVAGTVSTVNGTLALQGAEAGSLTTTNGDVKLSDGAVVHGDLTVKKPNSRGWSLFGRDRPRVTIGEDCRIQGELHFEQEVELVVAESASIGPVSGVEPVRP